MRDKYIYIKFAIIFFFTLGMIIWTIMQTAKAGVGLDDDNAFLSTYHDVDANFNKMAIDNAKFSQKYDVIFDFNGEVINGLTVEDVFLPQRAIQDRKIRKDMIKIGTNDFSIVVKDKSGNEIENKKVNILVTKSVTHDFDVKLNFDNESKKSFEVNSIGYWNITGTIEVDSYKGYFYIKTNAKK